MNSHEILIDSLQYLAHNAPDSATRQFCVGTLEDVAKLDAVKTLINTVKCSEYERGFKDGIAATKVDYSIPPVFVPISDSPI